MTPEEGNLAAARRYQTTLNDAMIKQGLRTGTGGRSKKRKRRSTRRRSKRR